MASKKENISQVEKIFLMILRDIIHKKNVAYKDEEVLESLKGILRLSSIHMVYPLVVDALYHIYPERMEAYKKRAIDQTVKQAGRTASFLLLYQKMQKADLSPIVMKGIVCRNLYEEPEARYSVDEDLLIDPKEIHQYHEFLLKHGFHLVEEDISIETADEISYRNADNHLYLEVHKHLFDPEDEIFGGLSQSFENNEESAMIPIYGTDIKTLGFNDHLLYMICHAYKHLIYSGFGIRQVCDMLLFAETYGKHMDWDRITTVLEQHRLTFFAEALLKICVEYLGMDVEKAGCSHLYSLCEVDELTLLKDILTGGIYGAQDENRLHSANMTLSAVSARKQGKSSKGLGASLFPSRAYMSGKYLYLRKAPFLLPVAWLQRIIGYLKSDNVNLKPQKTMQIGKQRIELLRKYKLL